jgi:hypothetical protein
MARTAKAKPRIVCRVCQCTDTNCHRCTVRTGKPCYWIRPGLCSACLQDELDRLEAIEAAAAVVLNANGRRTARQMMAAAATLELLLRREFLGRR